MLEDKNKNSTKLDDIGEFSLIDTLTKHLKIRHKSTIKSIGDDAAVLDYKSKKIVVSTDFLIEGIHFDLSYMPLKHLGYKAVMVNLSDIYAMNANAKHITVSVAISNRFSLEAIEELYSGIELAAKKYDLDIIGGDTTSSVTGLTISITALGEANLSDIVYRDGAKANDLIVVTGDLGSAFMGLKVLEREKEVFKVNPKNQPDLDQYTYLVERQLKPEARKDIIRLLSDLKVKPTSMIDISDGLSSELLHICNKSKVGCDLYENKIPMDPQLISTCEEFNINSTTITLNGGEDYELLMTISQKDYPKIKANPNLTVIGYIKEEKAGCNLILRDESSVELKARGWGAKSE
ncbi:MAG: thiamine-phosphate kinase [Bacteroidota bacterium]|nr:thiamine-phosphate kinase [Bacteroidota bacterium]